MEKSKAKTGSRFSKNRMRLALLVFALLISGSYLESYTARVILYNKVSIQDFKIFPQREIKNQEPPFIFPKKLSPELFGQIEYRSLSRVRRQSLDDLNASNQTSAFIVIQNDAILYENYFNGYRRDSLTTIFSVTKSFCSALIGIAIDEGLIKSVDDPVIKYVPELKGRGLDELTIRHLLNMSSGIKYQEGWFPWVDEPKSYYEPDLRRLTLSVVWDGEPVGKYFHYNNYHPPLEGIILERVTGKTVSAYLEEKIWKPLGMEYPASFSLDSETDGFEKLEGGLNARAIDLAKFGRLYLNRGNWNGKQIISEKWVLESTSPDPNDRRIWKSYPEFQAKNGYYKYHWWGRTKPEGSYDFLAIGNLGEYIYVCPKKNLIIVRLGKNYGLVDDWPDLFQTIAAELPAISDP